MFHHSVKSGLLYY